MQVPGDPNEPQAGPRPSMQNLLIAAGIMQGMGKFSERSDTSRTKLAGDVLQFPGPQPMTDAQRREAVRMGGTVDKRETARVLGNVLGRENVLPMTPGGNK